jgi:hypothetical protein
MEEPMSAYNIVRFKVKQGREREFIAAHKSANPKWPGFVKGALVKTGENAYCFVAEWKDFDSIVAARSEMIGVLDSFRDCLDDLGNGLGVTDPVSGEVVVEL